MPDGVVDFRFEVGQLALERFEYAVHALDCTAVAQPGASVALGDHHLDDLVPAGDQLAEHAGLGVRHRSGCGINRLGEMGDRLGVQGIGLGKLARCPREVADGTI